MRRVLHWIAEQWRYAFTDTGERYDDDDPRQWQGR